MRKVCPKAFVRKEPCINGKRTLKITNYYSTFGKCRPFQSTTSVFCESEKKQFCKCNVVDNLHYRTYDGQRIHFSGGCRYTLTRYNRRGDSCSFNIEVENEYRDGNKHLSHTKSVIIHMFGERFELGQHKTLKVGNIQRSIPYEKGEDVKIFHSNNFVQFVAPKCSVHVAFDKNSNAFIEVSKRYSKKIIGICGDCNGIQDDLKTKSGKDVSKNKDKYSRIANSYKINYLGRYCTPAEHVSYKSICRYSFIEKAKARNFCSAIVSSNSPFSKCGQHAHVDLKNFYEDCLIDMCANKNRRLNPKHVQCKTLGVLSEVCAESGIPGIKWRTHFQCPKKCGENEHFTHKASPCPRTCENHFFGSRRPCYDLPEREGCECNKGYIRDGALCVKPMHCSCINLCIDRKGSRMCWKWKARGDCEKFPEPMNIMCRKTCNFCKNPDQSCKNVISTKQCLLFRRQGLCFDDFYSSLCGLTCNYDKCKCGDDKVIVEKCNANYIITTTHYSFARDSNGRCVKTVKQSYRSCCPNSWTNHGNCNLCTGKRNITMYSYDVVKMKCVLRSNTRYENCQKCQENVREKRECIGEKYLKTTVYFNKLIGCFQCVPDQRISTTEIKCKTTKVVKRINRNTECTTIFKRTPLNCQCRTQVTRKCCSIGCPGSKTTKYCENGRFIYRTLSYKLDCHCIPQYSYRIEIPKCQPKRPTIGGCEKTKNKLFYCKAIETQYTANVNANCKCIRNTVKHERICCCKERHKYKKCNRNTGLLTTVYVSYQPVWRGKYLECVKRLYENSVLINVPPYIIKRGVCKSNDMQTIKISSGFRDGCKIKTSSYKYEKRCRCPKQIFTRKICVFNREIIKRFIKVLINAQCVNNTISKQEIPIICPNDQKIKSKCFHLRRTVTTISYHKYKCKCIKKVKKQIIICPCRDRTISEQTLKCNLNTCKQKHIVLIKRNCKSEKLVYYYACCCKPPIIKTNHCSSITGLITTRTETFYVVPKQFRCFSKTISSVTKPNCNNVKVIKQKCGQERINYKKITTIRQILSKQTCSCKTVTTSIWKCCKLPKSTVTKSCRGNYFLVKVVKYKFDVNKIKCISQTSHHIKPIQCPPIRDPIQTKYLPKCQYKQTRYYYIIQKCKCKLRKHSEIYYYRCCKRKRRNVKCVHYNKLITTFTSFHLSSDRKQCKKYVRKATQNITCRKFRESRTKKISHCEIHIITDYYRVRNCKCEKYNTKVVKKRFCCKKPIINESCLKHKIRRVTATKYTTKNFEICIKQISFVDNVIRCSPPYSRICPCIGNPSLKSIQRFFYVTVNCQCVFRKTLIPCACHKIPNKIESGPCTTKHTRTVKVFKSVNVKRGCKWELLKSYQDVCECPKLSIIKTCLKHSIYRTTTINYNLVTVPNQYPTHICAKSQIVKDKIIECNKNYISHGKCINYKQAVTECVYRSVNCKCEMSCRIIRYRSCDCQKLDNCNIKCIKNIKTSICHKHKPGPSQCILYFNSHTPIEEKCPSETNIQCEVSNNPINNCYFKSCKKSFYVYENCRCVKRKETTNTCSRCVKSKTESQCINNRQIMKITNFIFQHSRCHPIHHERIIDIVCPRWKVIKTKKHGYIHYKIIYYKIENCKCIRKICRGPYFRKKCPFSKLKIRCSRNNQLVYTHIVRQIHFSNRRFCPESGCLFREQICVEKRNVHIETKRCPNSYERITCIVSRNIKRIKKHYHKVVNCRCVKAVTVVETRPCKICHKPIIIHETKCGRLNAKGIGYIRITTKYWKITKRNICKPYIRKSKVIGCCRKHRIVNKCVNGKKIFKTIIYEVFSQCKPRISIISESIPCYNNGRPNKWLIERIHYCRRPGEFTIVYIMRKKFNPINCGCINERKSIKVNICCRRRHYRTVCRHNNQIVTISYCQRSEKLKCINYKRETRVQLRCPKSVKRVIGDCRGRVIRYRIVFYKSVKCRCVKIVKEYIRHKIRDVTKCINEMWRTNHIGYELYRHRCVKKRPQITFKPIICSKFETFQDTRIDHCDFYRSYFKKVVSNCQCVDRFIRKEILHYRCCQKPIISKTCVNRNTRVVLTTNFKLVNFKCYPVRRESRFTVDCSYLKLKKRINTGRCTYKVQYYYGATVNCKCYRAHKLTRFNLESCCHHLRPSEYQRCDKKRGLLITYKRSYTLLKHKCLPIISTIERPINCDGRICEKRYGKCIENTQTIELFCLKRRGCRCIKQIFKRHNVCCGPRKDSTWTETGKCKRRRGGYYRLITTYALQLNYRTNHCTQVVIKQQYKICRCHKSFVRKSCFKNIYIKTRKVSYKMNKPKNVCHKRVDESVTLISECSKTLSITMSERETIPGGWCIRTKKITTPVNCKCVERIKETRFWCPCYKPMSVKFRKYCRKNYIIVSEIHYPKCRLNNIYWRIVRTFTPILGCSNKQIIYGTSFPSSRYRNKGVRRFCTRFRYKTEIQWYVHNCICKKKLIKKQLICTECLPPRQREQCLYSKINIINYFYSIVNGICRRIINKKLIHIPCPKHPKIHQSACINNKYTITTTYYFYDNCRCRSRVEKKTCDCQCEKDSKLIKCSRKYFLNEITIRYHRKYCRCYKTVNVKRIEPSCPRLIPQTIGKCEIQKRHSIYRKITNRYIIKDDKNCKCFGENNHENEVCNCVKKTIKHTVCINNNNFVIQTLGWRINIRRNRCDKVLLNRNSKLISCPLNTKRKVCNYNIGRGKITIITYKLVNCKCIENKIVRQIICKCDPKLVLEHRGECQQNDRRIETYSHKEARGKHCVTVKERKSIICRCRKEIYNKTCTNNRIVHNRTLFILTNNSCPKTNIVKYESVICSQQIWIVKSKCKKHGFRTISYYGNTVRNCKCVEDVIRVQFCKCRCPRNRRFRKCHRSGNAVINFHVTYKLVGCSCKIIITKMIQPIQCPQRKLIVSGCNEVRCKGYWFRTIKVTNYHIRYCICVPVVKKIKSICKIKIFKQVSVKCDRKRKLEIRKVSKLIYKNGKCVRITRVKRIPITCNKRWVIVNRPICHLDGTQIRIYQRLYFKDCRCRQEIKVKRCDCRCKRPFVITKCKGNTIRKYFYRYVLNRCKCKRKLTRVTTKRIYCKSKILKIGPCFVKNNHCVRNVEYQKSVLRNCHCIKRRQIVQKICHSCCRSTKTKHYCEECPTRLITEITSCRVNYYGRIIKSSKVKSNDVSCNENSICVSQNDCDRLTSTETYKCTKKVLKNCRCVTQKVFIKKDLCECGRTKLKVGACKLKSCKRSVYQIRRKLVILRNNRKSCEKVVKKLKDEKCCCPKSKFTKKCLNNRLIQRSDKHTFNSAKKTCKSRINIMDITVPCGPKREVKVTFNRRTLTKTIKTINRRLVKCKCRTTKHIRTELYRCPNDRTTAKCFGNKWETIRYKYTMNNKRNKCIKSVHKRHKLIRCPTLRRKSFRFNIHHFKQCRKTVYRVKNCRCILVHIPRPCPCSLSCPRNTVTASCIPRQGIYRIFYRSYRFNRRGCICYANTITQDRYIRCAEKPRIVIRRATRAYYNGIYDSVTTVLERRVNCACIRQSSTRFVLNRCYYNYQRSRSHHRFFNYLCRKAYGNPITQTFTNGSPPIYSSVTHPSYQPGIPFWSKRHNYWHRRRRSWRRRSHSYWQRTRRYWRRRSHIYWRRTHTYWQRRSHSYWRRTRRYFPTYSYRYLPRRYNVFRRRFRRF